MKRVISLVLCLMLVFSLAISASAAVDYKIHIKNNDLSSAGDHTYYAYQIFGGELDSSGSILTEIVWGESIADGDAFLAALKAEAGLFVGGTNIFASATDAKTTAAILSKTEYHTHAILTAFAKVATAHVKDPAVAQCNIMTVEGTKGVYTIDIPDDMPGYYLVKDTVDNSMPNKDVSDYILQVVGEVTVEHKGSIPTLDKQVSETGSTYQDAINTGINETHFYRIVAELPDDYTLYDEYYLEFSDTFSAALTFDELVEVKAVIRSGGTPAMVIDSACYTVSPTAPTAGAHLQVVIEDTKKITSGGNPVTLTSEDAIEIIYKAHVNENAVSDGNGIPNSATIIYSNNPNTDGKGHSTPDETNVYPINLKLVKVDGKDTTVALAGAEFVLSRVYNEGTGTHTEYGVVDGNGKISKWVHHYVGDGCAADSIEHNDAVAANDVGSVLVTDASGNIQVSGLDTGSYDLIEIKAPDGYNKLAESIHVTVSATIDEENDKIYSMTGTTNQGTIVFDATNAVVQVTIPNFKGDVLPSTGGIGTTLFYVFGSIMVMGAVVLLVTKKRMCSEA